VVLLHEFGHCAGARWVDGDAHEVLLWPLGGLAAVEVPHTPRANFITAAAGPAVNLMICAAAGLVMIVMSEPRLRPPLNPFWNPYRVNDAGTIELLAWDGSTQPVTNIGMIVLARLFNVSWVLFLFNVLVIGFPLDGGRMFQCALWPRYGFAQATRAAIIAGFIFMLAIGVFAIVKQEVLAFCLALFIYVTCRQQWILLETGGEDSLFGYDFSAGYTSLERDQPPRRRRPNFIQRWLAKRAARKMQLEMEQREAEDRRMDELLEKVQREGIQALTDEERRFMARVSAKYRNRQ
jgi:Zn-dependent protease